MTDRIKPNQPIRFQVTDKYIQDQIRVLIQSIFNHPHVQDLTQHIENNPYHDHENVLEHVQTVFANLQILLQFEFVTAKGQREQLQNYLNRVIDPTGKLTARELLLIANSLHDIGKNTHLQVVDDQGNTKAPGHEHQSAGLVPKILHENGADITQTEISLIQLIVDRHDTYSESYLSANLTFEVAQDIVLIKTAQPQFYVELLLHIMADNFGAPIYVKYDRYLKEKIFNSPLLLPD